MAAQELNMGGITGIYSEVITCADPPPIPLESTRTSLLPFDGVAYERAEHWNKYHREVLDCFLKAGPVFSTFWGLRNAP